MGFERGQGGMRPMLGLSWAMRVQQTIACGRSVAVGRSSADPSIVHPTADQNCKTPTNLNVATGLSPLPSSLGPSLVQELLSVLVQELLSVTKNLARRASGHWLVQFVTFVS